MKEQNFSTCGTTPICNKNSCFFIYFAQLSGKTIKFINTVALELRIFGVLRVQTNFHGIALNNGNLINQTGKFAFQVRIL